MMTQATIPLKAPTAHTQVSGTSSRLLARKCACGASPSRDGECDDCRRKKSLGLQRRGPTWAQESVAPPSVHEVLGSPGQPLDKDTRVKMESRFGHEFGNVRVHADARAAESARSVNAVAYAVGRDIVFESGRYSPQTSDGERLLAHELAHVVQQQGQSAAGPLEVSQEDDAAEVEARSIAEAVLSGGDARPERKAASALGRSPARVARQAAAETATAEQDRPCDREQRQDVSPFTVRSCCIKNMRDEILGLMPEARSLVQRAIAALAQPESVADALRTHFRVEPGDAANIATIKGTFEVTANGMQTPPRFERQAGTDDPIFMCRQAGEETCVDQIGRPIVGEATNCHQTTPRRAMLCGNYEDSVATGATFLTGHDWARTVVHEYVHLACPEHGSILSSCSGRECETYQWQTEKYPPPTELAVRNPDSYAHFAREVHSARTAAAPGGAAASTDSNAGWIALGVIGGLAVIGAIVAGVVISQNNKDK